MIDGTALTAHKIGLREALLEPGRSSPKWLASSLEAMSQDFRPRLPARASLTDEQRSTVQEMSYRLASHLAPASDEEIAAAFGLLRHQFPARDMEAGEARAVARGFLMAMRGVPAFALEEAVGRILSCQAGINPDFMPTGPRMRQIADEISLKARWHAVQLRRLLEAEVEREVPEDERARVASRLRGLLAVSQEIKAEA